MQVLAGKFIVFDGPDGGGKTTQRDRLAQHLADQGLNVTTCKDPGGTAIGDRIRHVLLDYDLTEMDVNCETMLFMASRAQLVGEVIKPALQKKHVVLCDRFVSATCAYQGAAGYDIQRVLEVAPFAIGETWPDLTIILDVDVEAGFARTGRKTHQAGKHRRKAAGQRRMFDDAGVDAMEARSVDFHRKVREIYKQLPQIYPHPVTIMDASGGIGAVHNQVLREIKRLL